MYCVSDIPHQAVQIAIIVFGLSITATKISILCLYHRLFPTPFFRSATISLGVLCVIWLIAIESILIFKCVSMTSSRVNWIQASTCIDFKRYFLAANITETLLDFGILCLPLQVVSTLQLPPRQKMVLYMTFLVGGL